MSDDSRTLAALERQEYNQKAEDRLGIYYAMREDRYGERELRALRYTMSCRDMLLRYVGMAAKARRDMSANRRLCEYGARVCYGC